MTGSGEGITYGQLESMANQGAHLFRRLGLRAGDHIAVLVENQLGFFVCYWAAMRAGLYFTPIATHLTPGEVAHIVQDSGARIVLSSKAMQGVADALPDLLLRVRHWVSVNGAYGSFISWSVATEDLPTTPISDEVSGQHMLYSSGTTGRAKGIKMPFAGDPVEAMSPIMQVFASAFGFDQDTIYLAPTPLYHSAPLGYGATVMRLGGTVLVMDKFQPQEFMQAVARHRVTHTQVVPTMFVRLLKTSSDLRTRHDMRSLRVVVHSASPCPVPVKEQIMDWLGPVVWEFYGGSEGNGYTLIDPNEWLAHKGSVGRSATNSIRVVAEDGAEVPPGTVGVIYFVGGRSFAYHNDPERTQQTFDGRGWSTLGDMGYLGEEGYLYLTDRKSYMIISGGVNIYPQEIEAVLTQHPQVADVAVFGVPNSDFGEEVKAVVQATDPSRAGECLASELMSYCRQHLSPVKCPRSIDFESQLPRQDNGKLYKRLLRDRYWEGAEQRG